MLQLVRRAFRLQLLGCAVLLCGFAAIQACGDPAPAATVTTNEKAQVSVSAFQVDSGWGYMIMVDHKPFIKQDCIPAVSGKQVFKTKTDAEKTAALVVAKMEKNERINISSEELVQLGVVGKHM